MSAVEALQVEPLGQPNLTALRALLEAQAQLEGPLEVPSAVAPQAPRIGSTSLCESLRQCGWNRTTSGTKCNMAIVLQSPRLGKAGSRPKGRVSTLEA